MNTLIYVQAKSLKVFINVVDSWTRPYMYIHITYTQPYHQHQSKYIQQIQLPRPFVKTAT